MAQINFDYPITEEVLNNLKNRKRLRNFLEEALTGTTSNKSIIAFLGFDSEENTKTFDTLDNMPDNSDELIKKVCDARYPREYYAAFSEVNLFKHLNSHLTEPPSIPKFPKGTKGHDINAKIANFDTLFEVFRPIDDIGSEIRSYLYQFFRYLPESANSKLKIQFVKTYTDGPEYFPLTGSEKDIRNWFPFFSSEAKKWLRQENTKSSICILGPKHSQWGVEISLNNSHPDQRTRIVQHTSSSYDAIQLFDGKFSDGNGLDLEETRFWKNSITSKLRKRQAGAYPQEGRLRVLVVDFTGLSMSPIYYNDIQTYEVSQRIKTAVHFSAKNIGAPLCYDVFIPAFLSTSRCTFGEVVWLKETPRKTRDKFVQEASFNQRSHGPTSRGKKLPGPEV